MAVLVGSARIDEHGDTYGGTSGDQTGGEVSTQAWYRHKQGWRVLRPRDPVKAKRIAACMIAACANDRIGYDQWQRDTLYAAAEPLGFDCALVTKSVETDCSALVRVCLAYAGIRVASFRTYNQARVLLATGEFTELTDRAYTESSARLRAGDILVTPASGHTVVVLSDGPQADLPTRKEDEMDLIKKGSRGAQVKTLQRLLNAVMGSGLEVDGDCGRGTETAIRAYQSSRGLTADGQCGVDTWTKLLKGEE